MVAAVGVRPTTTGLPLRMTLSMTVCTLNDASSCFFQDPFTTVAFANRCGYTENLTPGMMKV